MSNNKEEITLKKDRVLEAASKCSTAKRTLEILCPEFFEKPKQDGWYRDKSSGEFLFYFKDGRRQYGFDFFGNWTIETDGRCFDKKDIPATPQEIETALIAEAEKRYKEGDRVVLFKGLEFNIPKNVKYKCIDDCRVLDTGKYPGNVYCEGKWAEILPSKKKMTLKEVEEKLGYEIEITD